ncbi:MAG: FecR domain-containing protein [Kiritimatiellia bacterium]
MNGKTITVFVCCALIAVTAFAAGDPVGRVVALRGKAVATGEDGKARSLKMKSPVFLNDKIVTAGNSRIQIMLKDKSFLSQGEKGEMVIDEYVYAPKKKKANCAVRMVKGFFRVVTGKITDLKPERFKVRTKMATIGIRGCDLGFKLKTGREEVYIINVSRGRKIVIEKSEWADGSLTGARLADTQTLDILTSGTVVTITEGEDPEERTMTVNELKQLTESTTMSGGSDGAGSEAAANGLSQASEAVEEGAAQQAEINKQEEADELTEGTSSSPPTEGPSDPPPEDLAPPEDDPGPPLLVGGHPTLNHWEWGIWEDGSVIYNGNRYLEDRFLSETDFQDIISSGVAYNLTGMGEAGAVVHHGGDYKILQGSCSLNVRVNVAGPADLTWDGTFSLNNLPDPDSVTFDLEGNIISGGVLQGSLTPGTYSLSINGSSYDETSITFQNAEGCLIRPKDLNEIIAAAGEYHFSNNDGEAEVDGAFGADVN